MKEIPLTKGKVTLVDDEDYEWLSQFKWCIGSDGYAVRVVQQQRVQRMIRMHREIAQPSKEIQVDHINGDRLDNRRENLRVCTLAENSRNRKPRPGSSQYKGVYRESGTGKWIAAIKVNKQLRRLGRFLDERDAAKAYDEEARRNYGEFAYLNFPD